MKYSKPKQRPMQVLSKQVNVIKPTVIAISKVKLSSMQKFYNSIARKENRFKDIIANMVNLNREWD
jgi:hypothetical protein